MSLSLRSLTVVVCTVLAASGAAQTPRDSLLISPHRLAQRLNDENLVLLHVGERAAYAQAHLPNARFIEQHDVTLMQEPGTRLSMQMPSPDSLRATLESMGISDGSRVVVYFANGWVSPATRVLLALHQAGIGGSLLDGGLDGWTRAGHATTSEVPAPRAGRLSPLRYRALIVDADYVKASVGKPGRVLVDGRSAAFYDGVSEGGPPDARRRGHIEGAVSIPYSSVTTESHELKPAAELAAMFARAGAKPGDTIIGYCHIGQQATAMLFAARTLGYDIVLYDGSFEDWARRGWPTAVPARK